MFKFWKWLYFLSEKKIKQLHLEKYHNDKKCPNCNVWFSISALRHNHTFIDNDSDIISTKCGQCNHTSHWNATIAPVLVLCDETGTPLSDNNE